MVPEEFNWTQRRLECVKRVLIVDDYRGAAVATAECLSLNGLQTRVAGGCAEALEIVRHWSPDVVLLDLMMPQRDGFATAQAIRRNPKLCGTFICAYTSKQGDYVARNSEGTLFDAYFRKGSTPDRLLAFLQQLCVSPEASSRSYVLS
ncbi:response regulator [Caballeronia cordobensis]|uniref:response regulator n=1 Tax=Caballeronia cordobensis TaxID=1353886 RepID=UPI00094F74CE|nr:response regulator [Caballeronia cordobensis]